MHAQIQIYLSERGGGGGSKPNGEKTALIFYASFCYFSPKFSRDAGGPTIYVGGGVQMLISIEFDRTCNLPGMGVGTPYPPPFWIRTCMTFKDYGKE